MRFPTDLAAGRIDYLCDAASTALPQVTARNVKAIAALAKNRSAVPPDVPTADEQGLADFTAGNWAALFLPRRTPEPIVRRLHDATVEAMATPWVRDRMAALGTDLVAPKRTASDYLGRFVAAGIEKWAGPIRASGVSAD